MGVHRTCGEPDEAELTPIGVNLNGSGRVHVAPAGHVVHDAVLAVPARVKEPYWCSGGCFPSFRKLTYAYAPWGARAGGRAEPN